MPGDDAWLGGQSTSSIGNAVSSRNPIADVDPARHGDLQRHRQPALDLNDATRPGSADPPTQFRAHTQNRRAQRTVIDHDASIAWRNVEIPSGYSVSVTEWRFRHNGDVAKGWLTAARSGGDHSCLAPTFRFTESQRSCKLAVTAQKYRTDDITDLDLYLGGIVTCPTANLPLPLSQ